MTALVRAWPWLLLLSAALVFGLAAAGGDTPADSPSPSVTNPGPRGAQVLATWLAESGTPAEVLRGPEVPPGVHHRVLAGAADRVVTAEEVAGLKRFVERGGTLIYLSTRPARAQPQLAHWLGLTDDAPLPAAKDGIGDVDGAIAAVTAPHPLLAGVRSLRVSADTGLAVEAAGAEPLAGPALWRVPLGAGEVLVAAGADLIENRRLDLLDNAQLWANVARRHTAIDEYLLAPVPRPAWSANLWAMLLQFVFVALLFVAARAPRLGPPRPALRRAHRSSLEYVASIAGLMQRAHVEPELKAALRTRLRRLMFDRLGIALALPADEASRQLASHTGLPPDAFAGLDRRLAGGDPFVAVAAEAARLEDTIVGRRAA